MPSPMGPSSTTMPPARSKAAGARGIERAGTALHRDRALREAGEPQQVVHARRLRPVPSPAAGGARTVPPDEAVPRRRERAAAGSGPGSRPGRWCDGRPTRHSWSRAAARAGHRCWGRRRARAPARARARPTSAGRAGAWPPRRAARGRCRACSAASQPRGRRAAESSAAGCRPRDARRRAEENGRNSSARTLRGLVWKPRMASGVTDGVGAQQPVDLRARATDFVVVVAAEVAWLLARVDRLLVGGREEALRGVERLRVVGDGPVAHPVVRARGAVDESSGRRRFPGGSGSGRWSGWRWIPPRSAVSMFCAGTVKFAAMLSRNAARGGGVRGIEEGGGRSPATARAPSSAWTPTRRRRAQGAAVGVAHGVDGHLEPRGPRYVSTRSVERSPGAVEPILGGGRRVVDRFAVEVEHVGAGVGERPGDVAREADHDAGRARDRDAIHVELAGHDQMRLVPDARQRQVEMRIAGQERVRRRRSAPGPPPSCCWQSSGARHPQNRVRAGARRRAAPPGYPVSRAGPGARSR